VVSKFVRSPSISSSYGSLTIDPTHMNRSSSQCRDGEVPSEVKIQFEAQHYVVQQKLFHQVRLSQEALHILQRGLVVPRSEDRERLF